MVKLPVLRTLAVAACVSLVAACSNAGYSQQPTGLTNQPYAVDSRLPVEIRFVQPGSFASRYVEPGDVILDVDHVFVNNPAEFHYAHRAYPPHTLTVRKPDGRVIQMPAKVLYESKRDTLWFSPLAPGETYSAPMADINNTLRNSAYFQYEGVKGQIVSATFPGSPNVMELHLKFDTAGGCNTDKRQCRLENIGVLDLGSRAWLHPIPSTDAAAMVYPSLVYPHRQIIPPSPVLARLPENMHGSGQTAHSFYGSAYTGQYPGVLSPYMRSGYDMNMPDFSKYYYFSNNNYPVVNDQMQVRKGFIKARQGNLRVGDLGDRRHYEGHVFFAVPKGYRGPFLAVVKGQGDAFGAARFEPVSIPAPPDMCPDAKCRPSYERRAPAPSVPAHGHNCGSGVTVTVSGCGRR
ncbi:MAG: hypothetical protein Alpg2KO_05600 [Alphaproteobacteria bacterium]